MLEELWTLLQAVLGFLVEIPGIVLDFAVGLAVTAAGLLEDLGEATGHEDALFLPAGRGAAILILGGIAMAAISLSIALTMPRTKRTGTNPGTKADRSSSGSNGTEQPWAPFSAAHADPKPEPAWLDGVRKAVAQNDVGEVVLLSERSGRHAVAIPPCSGPNASQGAPTCHRAGNLIRVGLRTVAPQGRVVDVSCTSKGGRACVFEILTGGTSP